MNKIVMINGANLNLLGKRQTHLYGKTSLENIAYKMRSLLPATYELCTFQSNHEGEIIDYLNQLFLSQYDLAKEKRTLNGIIINPGAFTHTSLAIRDALEVFLELNVKIYEVHLSNLFKREEFRHTSYISGMVDGIICGLGSYGYEVALHKILDNTISMLTYKSQDVNTHE